MKRMIRFKAIITICFIFFFISGIFAEANPEKTNSNEYSIKNLSEALKKRKKKKENNISKIIDYSVADVASFNNSSKHSVQEEILQRQIGLNGEIIQNHKHTRTHQEMINQEHELLWHKTFEDRIKDILPSESKNSTKYLIDKVIPSFKTQFNL